MFFCGYQFSQMNPDRGIAWLLIFAKWTKICENCYPQKFMSPSEKLNEADT